MSRRVARRYRNSSLRVRLQTGPQNCNNLGLRLPLNIVDIFSGGDAVTLRIAFDQQIILSSIPHFQSQPDNYPIDAHAFDETHVDLVYPSPPEFKVFVPFQDPGIRNASAGYVTPGTFDFT
jgi:hypothetical protein